MSEFFNMGGYAFYVWLSYGLTAVVLIANIIIPKMNERKVKRDLALRISGRIERNLEEKNNASSS